MKRRFKSSSEPGGGSFGSGGSSSYGSPSNSSGGRPVAAGSYPAANPARMMSATIPGVTSDP